MLLFTNIHNDHHHTVYLGVGRVAGEVLVCGRLQWFAVVCIRFSHTH